MACGAPGQRYLDVHIPVVVVPGIAYGCVIIPVPALVVTGAPEMQRRFNNIKHKHVLVNSNQIALSILNVYFKSRHAYDH